MKYFTRLLLVGILFSCGGQEAGIEEKVEIVTDTVDNGIIEYDLSEERLSAVDYNNEISLIQQNVYNQINELFTSDPNTVNQNLENAKFEIELKSNDLSNITPPEGGEALKIALMDLLTFYKTELDNGFMEILPLVEKDGEERSSAQEYRINDYDEQFAISEADLFNKIVIEQDKFAIANNFKMSDS